MKAAGDRAVRWIEGNLRHYQGRWAGQPFYLLAWQKRLIRELFGWRRADGTRLYRRCYVEAPRKSGKTMLAGAIALYLAYGDGEAGPQIGFAAYDQEQAKLCYGAARFMIEANPELFEQTLIYNSALEMKLKDNPGGILRCLSRESKQQYGLNLHGLVFDELMTQKTRDMWNALTSAQGAREQPLQFAISTAGWDQLSVCFEQHELVRQIHEGNAVDDVFLGVVFGAPMDADWTDEEVWKRANPSLGETVTLDSYREHAKRAANQPTEQNAFRTLMLSQWSGKRSGISTCGPGTAATRSRPSAARRTAAWTCRRRPISRRSRCWWRTQTCTAGRSCRRKASSSGSGATGCRTGCGPSRGR